METNDEQPDILDVLRSNVVQSIYILPVAEQHRAWAEIRRLREQLRREGHKNAEFLQELTTRQMLRTQRFVQRIAEQEQIIRQLRGVDSEVEP